MMRMKGIRHQQRVYGPALVNHLLSAAAERDISVGFYGSTPEVLHAMIQRAKGKWPDLIVACRISPPFRELRPDEAQELAQQITESGARILFVGLGCPKQERWMAAHRGRIPAVMIGVGAAFDFLAGTKPMAPRWMQTAGLEWLFRLMCEPRRLWRRYLYQNPRFMALAAAELLGIRRF
jgi:N-acetylglucosaminyldiphosphoundecaprenol N-acetyl-beta-D-mannosaminyltransferase